MRERDGATTTFVESAMVQLARSKTAGFGPSASLGIKKPALQLRPHNARNCLKPKRESTEAGKSESGSGLKSEPLSCGRNLSWKAFVLGPAGRVMKLSGCERIKMNQGELL